MREYSVLTCLNTSVYFDYRLYNQTIHGLHHFLGGANDYDIEEAVHHFISNLFLSNRPQTFLNCQTVDV
jgi:hypothetical protein